MRFILASLAFVVLANGVREATAKAKFPEDGTMYGLSEYDLTQLYDLWLRKETPGTDKSFKALISWMKEYDDSVNLHSDTERQDFCLLACWIRRIDDSEDGSEAAMSNVQRSERGGKENYYCPSNFDYLPEVNGCFKVIYEPLSWNNATSKCREMNWNANLATITSAPKQRAIQTYLQYDLKRKESRVCIFYHPYWPTRSKMIWVGGQTRDPKSCKSEYVWKTLNGVEVPFTYNYWKDGQPDCSGNNEHCIHIASSFDYSWNDASCNQAFCALCEL